MPPGGGAAGGGDGDDAGQASVVLVVVGWNGYSEFRRRDARKRPRRDPGAYRQPHRTSTCPTASEPGCQIALYLMRYVRYYNVPEDAGAAVALACRRRMPS